MPDVAEPEVVTEEQPPDPISSPARKAMENKLTTLLKEVSDKKEPSKEAPAPDKPAEKPVEKAPAEEPLPEAILRGSPKASEEFKKVRAKAQQHQKESEKLKAELDAELLKVKTMAEELAKVKATPPPPAVDPAELEALRKERQQLSDELKAASIERHPEFRRHFESRTMAATEKAKPVIGQELTDKAARLSQLPSSDFRTQELDKMMRDLSETSPFKATVLADLVREMSSIAYDRDQELKKARDSYDVVQKVEHDKMEAAKAGVAKRRANLEATSLEMAKTMEAFKRGDDEAFNASVATRESFIKDFFAQRLDDKILAGVPVLAMEGAYATEVLVPSLRSENEKLLKQIKEMTQATPTPSKGLASDSTKIEPKKGMGFLERYKANAPGQ